MVGGLFIFINKRALARKNGKNYHLIKCKVKIPTKSAKNKELIWAEQCSYNIKVEEQIYCYNCYME